jgi:signal transduction histidine kinase
LGLSITYGILKDHHGSISVASQPGEGARFTMQFPIEREALPKLRMLL